LALAVNRATPQYPTPERRPAHLALAAKNAADTSNARLTALFRIGRNGWRRRANTDGFNLRGGDLQLHVALA